MASFNVLNFFNGDGAGGGFPSARGANTAEEFERQAAKIVSAIRAMDVDIIGQLFKPVTDATRMFDLTGASASTWPTYWRLPAPTCSPAFPRQPSKL